MKKLFLFAIFCVFTHAEMVAQCTNCENTENNGTNSSAIGIGSVATGVASFASGEAIAEGNYSTSMGFQTQATGQRAVAIGYKAKAQNISSIALGFYVTSSNDNAIVIGSGLSVGELNNNIFNSLMVGFNSKKPTLFVGPAPTVNNNDATGKIGIGNITDPLAKLHIYSDDDESATLFLQPSNWTSDLNAEIFLGDMNHGISAEVDAGMVYNTEEYHVFKGGDVFIDDIDKGIIMKSPDGNCWRGVLDNSGNLQFTVLETCPEITVAVPETNELESKNTLKVYPNPTNDYLTIELAVANQNQHTVSLLDEKGAILITKRFQSSQTKLYTGDLPSGIYFVHLTGEKTKLVQKVIKQ